MNDPLARLAAAHGIALSYRDIEGVLREATPDTLRAVLSAMHVEADSEAAVAASLDQVPHAAAATILPAMVVARRHRRPWLVPVRVPQTIAAASLSWQVTTEAGERHALPAVPVARADTAAPAAAYGLTLDIALPCGYHALTLLADGEPLTQSTLAVVPQRCYRPPALRDGGRTWGISVQLYGLRSARNLGIGDFTDLGTVAEQWGAAGADVVGVNPLHALFPDNPAHASPYSPSSRLFLNVLYLDVEGIPEFTRCAAARAHVATLGFRSAVAALREAPLVDYPGVAAAKMPVLALLFAQARRDAQDGASARWSAFEAFRAEAGLALQRQATFDALQAHFRARDAATWGWPAWPEAYRDPDSAAVAQFAREAAEEVAFHAWLQWQAAAQRADAAVRARRAGMRIGLFADLAVSVDRGGAEAWARQDLYAAGASVGAPPDAFSPHGQDWGLPPLIPGRLRDAGYAPLLATLRAGMRDAGALRIDHVMGLFRLFWVPAGAPAAQGAYVSYPADDLLGLVALESHRHRCLVIGEDLGTVPDAVREALAEHDLLAYRVVLFERDRAGGFLPPAAYPEASLTVASTHDLPTLAGWWAGHDLAVRADYGLLSRDAIPAQLAERVRDRGRLLAALAREGLLPDGVADDPAQWPELTQELALALQVFLARTPSALCALQLDDAFGIVEQANLPGTIDGHPNWRRKLPVPVDGNDARIRRLAARIGVERGRP